MNTDLIYSTYADSTISDEDFQRIVAAHKKVSFAKGDFLLKEGEISNHYYLLESGMIRSYVHNYEGDEITTEFYTKNDIVIEETPFFQRVPSQQNIICASPCEAWQVKFDDFEELFVSVEGFIDWGRSWLTMQLFISKQRALDIITKSATERYLSLLSDRQAVIQQAPVKQIASYLGITDTSLSRIRKEIAET